MGEKGCGREVRPIRRGGRPTPVQGKCAPAGAKKKRDLRAPGLPANGSDRIGRERTNLCPFLMNLQYRNFPPPAGFRPARLIVLSPSARRRVE